MLVHEEFLCLVFKETSFFKEFQNLCVRNIRLYIYIYILKSYNFTQISQGVVIDVF